MADEPTKAEKVQMTLKTAKPHFTRAKLDEIRRGGPKAKPSSSATKPSSMEGTSTLTTGLTDGSVGVVSPPDKSTEVTTVLPSYKMQARSDEEKKKLLTKVTGLPQICISNAMLEKTGTIDWRNFGKSPIMGYDVNESGLWDRTQDPNVLLSANSVRELINETAKLEAVSHQGADGRLGSTAVQHGFNGIEALYPPCLMMAACFFSFWKLPRAWAAAYPRNSFLVRHWYQDRLSETELETLCQRRATLFTATNSRVVLLGSGAIFCTTLAVVAKFFSKPQSAYTTTTKTSIQYYQHFEGTLKWLFSVYYHHPAYSADARMQMKPIAERKDGLPPGWGEQ